MITRYYTSSSPSLMLRGGGRGRGWISSVNTTVADKPCSGDRRSVWAVGVGGQCLRDLRDHFLTSSSLFNLTLCLMANYLFLFDLPFDGALSSCRFCRLPATGTPTLVSILCLHTVVNGRELRAISGSVAGCTRQIFDKSLLFRSSFGLSLGPSGLTASCPLTANRIAIMLDAFHARGSQMRLYITGGAGP